MILYITFSGKDLVHIYNTHVKEGIKTQKLGVYDFATQKEGGVSFVEFLLSITEAQKLFIKDTTGIIVQWGAESRFTVSRLTGVTLNALAVTHQLPIITQAQSELLEAAIERLRRTTTTRISIEYSAEPRLG